MSTPCESFSLDAEKYNYCNEGSLILGTVGKRMCTVHVALTSTYINRYTFEKVKLPNKSEI